MSNVEIERKFLIKELPSDLESFPHRRIEQAYLCKDPTIRVRRDGDKYYMTYKGRGLMERSEYNLPLDEASYLHLAAKADGNTIKKERYVIPISLSYDSFDTGESSGSEGSPVYADSEVAAFLQGGSRLFVELDIFEYPAGLIMAEVEFPSSSLGKKFRPLPWFDREVTEDPKYHNSNMT